MNRDSVPRVSVVISTYNSEMFIRGRLENLVEQTIFDRCEVIVVISGSQQNEELIVKEYESKYPNIHSIITPQRETIYKAWNRGAAASRGKYVTNANTDDRLRKDALEVMAATLDHHAAAAMVYADQYITTVPNSTFEESRNLERFHRQAFTRLRLLSKYDLGSQPMWRSSLHTAESLWFDERFEVAGDYDFACRVAERHNIMRIPQVLGVDYRAPNKTNKEYQDSGRTALETCDILDTYGRRYVASLPDDEFNLLFKRMKFWIRIPRTVYTLLHRGIRLVMPEQQILNRVFWCWMGSLLYEHKGRLAEAESVCVKYLSLPAAAIVRRQYDHVKNLRKQNA
jgi:glycosyltransferase involved in cell wall biosynthesis